MTWRDQPSIRGTGNIMKHRREDYYSNPPGYTGLHGLQINKKPEQREPHIHDGVVGTASFMSRKGEPFS